jgi:nucleotide-binding universal stress UspA family protein
MSAFKKILVPTNFSPIATEAFRVALDLARMGGSDLVVAHFTRDVAMVVENGPVTIGEAVGNRHNLWDDFRPSVSDDPKVRVTHELVAGQGSAAEIMILMEKFGCDLIVIGSHGHGRLHRFVFGSLTDRVVRQARCPVLVVKTPSPRAAVARAVPAPAPAGRIA